MSSNSRIHIEEVQWLASCAMGLFFVIRCGVSMEGEAVRRPPLTCSHCGGELRLLLVTDGSGCVLVNHRQRYLDSG